MARRSNPLPPPPPPPKRVTCATCRLFTRDTTGPSYNNDTHEYFMGVCGKGLTPDNMRKVFANKPRPCPHHQPQQPKSDPSD